MGADQNEVIISKFSIVENRQNTADIRKFHPLKYIITKIKLDILL